MSNAQIDAFLQATPIVLDLDGNGVRTVAAADGVMFDIAATGNVQKVGWASAGDGLLVRDRNHDGQINDGRELFGVGTEARRRQPRRQRLRRDGAGRQQPRRRARRRRQELRRAQALGRRQPGRQDRRRRAARPGRLRHRLARPLGRDRHRRSTTATCWAWCRATPPATARSTRWPTCGLPKTRPPRRSSASCWPRRRPRCCRQRLPPAAP